MTKISSGIKSLGLGGASASSLSLGGNREVDPHNLSIGRHGNVANLDAVDENESQQQ